MFQIGRTTNQLKQLPLNAVFVWRDSNLSYPQALAKRINRLDIEIVSPFWVTEFKYVGRELTGFSIDHSINSCNKIYSYIPDILARIR